MLKLPDVTLVLRDVLCPDLARLALLDSLAAVEPQQVVIFSDTNLKVPNTKWVKVKKWGTLLEHCTFFWHEQHNYIKTPWFISIEWDGWITDPDQWSNDFLTYDYIGAPWWYNDRLNVGNGLGLRSNKLMKFLSEHRDEYPVEPKEDEVLCRQYRPSLERFGFRWAPERVASQFSFECSRPSVFSRHFMFHDSFNFPVVLSGDRLDERLRLMRENPYITNNHKLRELEGGRRAMILDRLAS